MEIQVENADPLIGSADEGSAGSSVPNYVALAAALAAAAIAVTGATLYARKRSQR